MWVPDLLTTGQATTLTSSEDAAGTRAWDGGDDTFRWQKPSGWGLSAAHPRQGTCFCGGFRVTGAWAAAGRGDSLAFCTWIPVTVWQCYKLDARGAGLVENETSLARSAAGASGVCICAVGPCFKGGNGMEKRGRGGRDTSGSSSWPTALGNFRLRLLSDCVSFVLPNSSL